MLMQSRTKSFINFLAACLLAGFLAACGGGGTNDGCLNIDPSRSSSLPSCSGSGTTTNPGSGNASKLTLAIADASGTAINNLMPGTPATLTAVLKDSKGLLVANAVVSFETSDSTGVFSPSSGTALTDANGAASVKLAAGTQAGAYTVTANATVGGTGVKATASYTVSFPNLSMSDITVSPTTLPAGGNASVTVSVLNGTSPYMPTLSVSFSSPCISAGKASIGTPVMTQNGTAVASYTDKGCSTSDQLTATVVVPNATLTKSTTINVLPAVAGSIKFVSVSPSNIALKGTGGVGRPENSIVKFQVFDNNGIPVVGKLVNFVFGDSNTTTTTGGLTTSPASATSAADGTVTTSVSGGTIPTSVRVVATVSDSSPILTTVTSLLVVSSGVADQAHFTVGFTIGNCEGWDINQECGQVEVLAGDHFSNQVPDGTVINFTSEGGVIQDSCTTANGKCKVPLYAANPRPSGGKVTVMAYMIGEESFTDTNGNNVYDAGEPFVDTNGNGKYDLGEPFTDTNGNGVYDPPEPFSDLKPDIFRDDDENGAWTTGEPCISTHPNSTCSTPGDGIYNGVLRVPQQPSAQVLYISSSAVAQFSTSSAKIDIITNPITCPAGGTTDVQVKVTDLHDIWMPAGTVISFSTLFGTAGTTVVPASATVRNVVLGVGSPINIPTYTVTIACPSPSATGQFIVTVRSPSGVETTAKRQIN
jgi:hypothetical protein